MAVVDVDLNFLCPKTWLNCCWRITRTNKQMTRVPSPRPISHSKKPVSICANKMELCFCDLTRVWSSESDSHKNQPRNANYLSSFKFKEPTFLLFTFFTSRKSKGYHLNIIQYEEGFNTVRDEAYRRYIPPVLPVLDTSVSSVRHQYRYRTFR